MREGSFWVRLMVAGLLAGSLAFAGCSADDGSDGAQGAQGLQGEKGDPGSSVTATATESCAICHGVGSTYDAAANHAAAQLPPAVSGFAITGVTIAADGQVTVTFTADSDPAGADEGPLFNFAKLENKSGGAVQAWKYVARESKTTAGAVIAPAGPANTYTYTSPTFKLAAGDVGKTLRFVLNWEKEGFQPADTFFDLANAQLDGVLVTAQAPAGASKRVSTTSACLQCHDWGFKIDKSNPEHAPYYGWYAIKGRHGDYRSSVETCTICHNRYEQASLNIGLANDPASGTYTNIAFNTHRRHSAPGQETIIVDGVETTTIGYAGDTYPQAIKNCRTCHTAEAGFAHATLEGDNWKNKPSRMACAGCHLDINFNTGVGHSVQTDDSSCKTCHPASGSALAIEDVHLTPYKTKNNPGTPTDVINIDYAISDVTVNASNQPVVTFTILANSQPLDLSKANLDAKKLGSGPSFLLAYAAPQDGIAAPKDWNQVGRKAGQPETIKVTDALGATPAANADGSYTVTLNSSFPSDATMRAVGLQGYFTQTEQSANLDYNGDGDVADTFGRYTKSVIKEVTGDPARRVVVDNAKCLGCHDTLQLHGGNRVDEVAICVTCHNPNLSASGKELVLANPETSNNFKDMIHGIHSPTKRETPIEFVRNFNGNGRYFAFISYLQKDEYADGHVVGFPGNIANCTNCHFEGTYGITDIPAGALVSVQNTTDGANATTAAVAAARTSMPNGTDIVAQPIAAACYSCHASIPLKGHAEQNGGGFIQRRLVTGQE